MTNKIYFLNFLLSYLIMSTNKWIRYWSIWNTKCRS